MIIIDNGFLQVTMKVTRQRKFFGAPKTLKDRNSSSAKDGYFECASIEDKSFDLMRAEMETGVQVNEILLIISYVLFLAVGKSLD